MIDDSVVVLEKTNDSIDRLTNPRFSYRIGNRFTCHRFDYRIDNCFTVVDLMTVNKSLFVSHIN